MIVYLRMVKRDFWLEKINNAWKSRSVIWLNGVRRVGKTYLCKSIPNIEYFDFELYGVRQQVENPELFLKGLKKKKVIFDEIHRLDNPSELLKIASDYFPDIKVIATGSSTLGTSKKFKDTLTGRKFSIWLTPLITKDLKDFNNQDYNHRFLFGGLPPNFLQNKLPEYEFEEWISEYWSKDIEELFKLERKSSFQKFIELLFVNSGGIFEATKYAKPCEVSRVTINNYLNILDQTFVANIVRPFSTYKVNEIVKAPKVYAFDTGFVCYYRSWNSLRPDDMGVLWEHFVLNEINAETQTKKIMYWRNKQGNEIDFIISPRGKDPIAIECKWKSDNFNSSNLEVFRRTYQKGLNYVVSHDIDRTYKKKYGSIEVTFVSLRNLVDEILKVTSRGMDKLKL